MKYDKDETARLVAELREDDARMTRGSWVERRPPQIRGAVDVMTSGMLRQVAQASAEAPAAEDAPSPTFASAGSAAERLYANAAGIARLRNNARPVADQLEAAMAEIDRLIRESATLRSQIRLQAGWLEGRAYGRTDEEVSQFAEIKSMRPVVEAAERLRTWRDGEMRYGADLDRVLDGIIVALDAYRARKP